MFLQNTAFTRKLILQRFKPDFIYFINGLPESINCSIVNYLIYKINNAVKFFNVLIKVLSCLGAIFLLRGYSCFCITAIFSSDAEKKPIFFSLKSLARAAPF